jgi:hypothetical protein
MKEEKNNSNLVKKFKNLKKGKALFLPFEETRYKTSNIASNITEVGVFLRFKRESKMETIEVFSNKTAICCPFIEV